jgi:LPS-assembly lipoprotein
LQPLAFLAVLVVLAGCSGIRPLYGTDAVQPGHYAFHYAEPVSRLDQVVYRELRLRLGPDSDTPDALKVTVATTAGGQALTHTGTAKPATTSQMTVTASVSVIGPEGDVVFSGTRSAAATYTSVGQVLSDTEGFNEAAERGARSVAETIRLAILGALSRDR